MSQPTSQSAGADMDVVRIETALSRYPIHRLANKGTVSIDIRKKDAKGTTTMSWAVDYGNRHGQPGPLAYKLDTLVINRKIDEAGRPTPRVLSLGSLHEIAVELGLGRNTAAVRKALLQNVGAIINAKITYKAIDKTERTLEAVFSRYSVVFTGEQLPDGRRADSVYLILNEPYAEVIDAATRRPQDYDYLKDLPPAPQRFYEIISYQMLPAITYNQRAKLPYSEFCLYSTITRYFEFERVKKQMYKIHQPHVKARYLAKIEYEATVDADGRPDWNMFYQPGETARYQQYIFDLGPAAQKKGLEKKGLGKKVPVKSAKPAFGKLEGVDAQSRSAEISNAETFNAEASEPNTLKSDMGMQLSLQSFSLDFDSALNFDSVDADCLDSDFADSDFIHSDFAEPSTIRLVPAPSALPAKTESAQTRVAKPGTETDRRLEQSEAEKLVQEFYRLRYGRSQDPTDREITEARQFLAEGGGWAQHLVAFAARRGKDKDSFPNDFGGVKKLVSHARESFDVQRKTATKVQDREARQSHQKAHRDTYNAFLGSLLGEGVESSLSEATGAFCQSEAYAAFAKQEQATFRFHQGRAGKSVVSARLVNNFYLPETRINRLTKFIEENPQYGLLNFWQWDKTLNPTPFQPAGE